MQDVIDRKTQLYFDNYAPEYSISRFSYVLEFVNSRATCESSLVDIGCGAGNIIEHFQQGTSIQQLCGIDIAPNYVKMTKDRLECETHLASESGIFGQSRH